MTEFKNGDKVTLKSNASWVQNGKNWNRAANRGVGTVFDIGGEVAKVRWDDEPDGYFGVYALGVLEPVDRDSSRDLRQETIEYIRGRKERAERQEKSLTLEIQSLNLRRAEHRGAVAEYNRQLELLESNETF